jgi:putative nucleotidyltransferase with HDIG domain
MTDLLSVAQLRPDMLLSGDVRAYNGRLLLPKDLCLAEKHIKIMKMWGVAEAPVKKAVPVHPDVEDCTRISPADLGQAQQQVRSRFCHVPMDHPAISALYQCAVERMVKDGQRGSGKTVVKQKPAMPRGRYIANAGALPAQFAPGDLCWDNVSLPTFSVAFAKINETVMNPRSSAYDIAAVIGKDTGLVARLLKIANSAFYGFPSRIGTIQQAVTIIGAKQLTTLTYAANVIDVFRKIPAAVIDMASFWRHSVACGICARILAGYKNIQNTERLFVAGLLHDIGRLIFYQHATTDMGCLIARARSDSSLLYELEFETLNIDHAAMGARLVKRWKLPALLEDIVDCHHAPQKSYNGMETAIVHLADIMTNAMSIGSSGESLVPPLDLQAWDKLGLSEHALSSTIQQMDQQLKDVFNIFFPDEKQTRKYH